MYPSRTVNRMVTVVGKLRMPDRSGLRPKGEPSGFTGETCQTSVFSHKIQGNRPNTIVSGETPSFLCTHSDPKMPILADYFMSVTVPPTGRERLLRITIRREHRSIESSCCDCGSIPDGGTTKKHRFPENSQYVDASRDS